MKPLSLAVLLIFLLTACSPATPIPPTASPTATSSPAVLATAVLQPTALPTFTPTPPAEFTPTVPPSQALAPSTFPAYIIGLTFIDPRIGWAAGLRATDQNAGQAASQLALASTTDGGMTWQSITLPNLNLDPSNGIHGGLFFSNISNGWLYYKGLISTADSGQTWVDEHPAGQILRIQRAPDGTLWALEKTADSWKVWNVTALSYAKWTPLLAKLPVPMDGAALTLADPNRAWVIQPGEPPDIPGNLYSTQDGGQSWQSQSSPCNPFGASISSIQAVTSTFLWLGCGQPGGAGSGSKFIFTSADSGQTWQIHGKATLPPLSTDTLPASGYFNAVYALSPTFAFMTWDRALVVAVTRDGGATWEQTQLPCSAEFSHAFFLDPLHGWAYDQSCINRTLDGGKTWNCLQLPGSQACPATK